MIQYIAENCESHGTYCQANTAWDSPFHFSMCAIRSERTITEKVWNKTESLEKHSTCIMQMRYIYILRQWPFVLIIHLTSIQVHNTWGYSLCYHGKGVILVLKSFPVIGRAPLPSSHNLYDYPMKRNRMHKRADVFVPFKRRCIQV